MGFNRKIRDLKQQIDEVRTDINSVARTGLRAFGRGEVYPVQTGEPQKTFMWEIGFLGDTKTFRNAKLYAKSASIPNSSVEVIETNYMGNKVFYSGKDASSHTLTVTFWDNEDMEVTRFLQEWHNILHDPTYGVAVRKSYYTKTLKLMLKDTSDLFTTADFYFEECFPTEIGEINLAYDNNEPIEVTVTFSFDNKYAGKPPSSPSGPGDAFKSYLDLDSYVSAFTGDFGDLDLSIPDIKDFF